MILFRRTPTRSVRLRLAASSKPADRTAAPSGMRGGLLLGLSASFAAPVVRKDGPTTSVDPVQYPSGNAYASPAPVVPVSSGRPAWRIGGPWRFGSNDASNSAMHPSLLGAT